MQHRCGICMQQWQVGRDSSLSLGHWSESLLAVWEATSTRALPPKTGEWPCPDSVALIHMHLGLVHVDALAGIASMPRIPVPGLVSEGTSILMLPSAFTVLEITDFGQRKCALLAAGI